MKKERKLATQKKCNKKVVESGNQVIVKRERGITLIALVVTIIIMLILAGVALSMALGDNGLFQMAKFSRNKYEQAATNESTAMGEMEEVFPKTARELTKDNYGDYVDYGLDLSGDGDYTNDWRIFYVGDVPKNGGDGAEGEETEKRVFLIAADYVPNTNLALTEAETSNHANMTKSSSSVYSCCSYWGSSTAAEYHCNDGRTPDPNPNKDGDKCSFPEIFMPSGSFCEEGNHYYCSSHVGNDGKSGNVNSRCASALQCTGNWGSFVEQSTKGGCANYAIGGPTLEMWVASWNQKHGSDTEEKGKTLYADGTSDSADNTGYYVGNQQECTSTVYSVNGTTGYSDTLYFPHKGQHQNLDLFNLDEPASEGTTETSENASCSAYWLSSPSAKDANSLMVVTWAGSVEPDNFNINDNGVRPVVSLKSNVKLTKRDGTGERVVYDINT